MRKERREKKVKYCDYNDLKRFGDKVKGDKMKEVPNSWMRKGEREKKG